MEQFKLSLDGVSDFNDAISRLITFGGNVIQRRVISILKYFGASKISKLVNTGLMLIPDEIDIPSTNIYIQGGVTKNARIV